MPFALLLLLVTALLTPASTVLQAQGSGAAAALDFAYFRTKVEPILSATRPGHTRCISCHGHGTTMRLVPPAPGAKTWTEEESRRNFQTVAFRVMPRSPMNSRLLVHPLATEGGGTFYHTGGKHWENFFNPEWQTIANWICGVKANEKTWQITGACPEEMH